MIRLALIGGVAAYHGRAFSGLINGLAAGQTTPEGWPKYEQSVADARIVTVWDPDRDAARQLAAVFGIERVTDTMEAAGDRIDAVIITDDLTMQHQQRARPFLERGIPTYIDKPLSADPAEAASIVAVAEQHGTALMSCSALRFAVETAELRANPEQLGRIAFATTVCNGELVFYGIHALELAFAIMGPGVRSVYNVGQEKSSVVRLAYEDGRSLVLMVGEEIAPVFQLNLYGSKGRQDIIVRDATGFYSNMLGKVVEMARTKQSPVPPRETLEIIRILAAAKQSLAENREITL
jgi:predicted dehydrogenase